MPAWLVVWENSAGPASASDCRRIQEAYGLERVRVLYPNPGGLESVGMDRRHTHYVLGPGAQIVHLQSFRDTTFEPVLQQLVGAD